MSLFFRLSISILFILSLAFAEIQSSISAQTINTKFGKNRVQFHDDFNMWSMYESNHYITYWYGKERNIAKTAILLNQISYSDIEEILDYKMNKKIHLIVYSDLSDFKQTNLGIKRENNFTGPGITKFHDNKILVYYDGNHKHLLNQIREGTAKVFLKNMFKELTFENIYKKLIYSDFPSWFIMGATKYLANTWDIYDDNSLRNHFLTSKINNLNFTDFAKEYPELAGKSFFYYIQQKYGKEAISDIFYLVRVSRDIKTSFYNVTNIRLKQLFIEWKNFYIDFYKSFTDKKITPSLNHIVNLKNKSHYTSLAISNDENYFTYAINRQGKITLYIHDIKVNKNRKLLKQGYFNPFQLTDYNYPKTCFNESSSKLAVLYEKKNIFILKIIDLNNFKYNETILSPEYRAIYSMDFWDDKHLILNASVDGSNDLFKYSIKLRQGKRLTNDFWDDVDARVCYYNSNKGIVFSSNRKNSIKSIQNLDSIPPIDNFDIYFLNIDEEKIIQLTNTPDINERQAFVHNNKLRYLTDETGIINLKEIDFNKSEKSIFITNQLSNINYCFTQNKLCLYTFNDLKYNYLRINSIDKRSEFDIIPTHLISKKEDKANPNTTEKNNYSFNDIEIDKSLLFQSKYKDPPKIKNTTITEKAINHISKNITERKFEKFKTHKAFASRLRFSFSELITKVDNEPLFDGMETYTENQDNYTPPRAGFLVKSRVKDLFEDYFLETGVRISPDFSEKEYFSVFENLKRRIDWQFAYYRKTRSSYDFERSNIIDKYKLVINLGQVRAKYPFDIYSSISLTTRLRFDKNILYASDKFSLNSRDITEQRLCLKLEYIFDNTSQLGTNKLDGNRSKVFLSAYNKFNIRVNNPKSLDLSTGLMGVIGFDTRQYFAFLKNTVLAFRLAGQTSFGSERNLYFLGGMENWQFSKNSDLVPLPDEDNFAFKILAANIRGFGYNARNGSSFVLFNSELRIPIFQYFFDNKIKKAFFRDFQITGFFDAGMAWRGISPFSDKNPSNIKTIDIPPSIKIKLRYYADPMIAGYGIGMRTSVFGYFMKLDYGWGIESGTVRKPLIYLTMGLDF